MSRTCEIHDSIDCEAPIDVPGAGPVVACWACGDDTCRGCSSIVSYRWRGQQRRMRFCFRCQDERGVGRGKKAA